MSIPPLEIGVVHPNSSEELPPTCPHGLLHAFFHKSFLTTALLTALIANEITEGICIDQHGCQLSKKCRGLSKVCDSHDSKAPKKSFWNI